MDEIRHFVMGLQESGKTTFAAALWYLLDSNSENVDTKLKKGKHQGDYTYLEEIAARWSSAWRVTRTGIDEQQSISINLRDEATGSERRLEFTDLSGESFEKIFATRRCDSLLPDLVTNAQGVLLFVSARRKIDDHTILDFPELETEVAPGTAGGAGDQPEKEPEFDPAKVPQQVQIVDLLQALAFPPFSKPKLRVAVIVSAWDLSRSATPDEWLGNSMPLLRQYLSSNHEIIEFRAYGVSAQGRELPKMEDGPEAMRAERDKILTLPDTCTRIQIKGADCNQHDLTAPLAWLARSEDRQ